MGMAASQARYLGLTARKTNCEYEGQQINQARTALANQSANLFNRLLDLEVPVAPKTTDYTEVQYSYSDGQNESVIDSWQQLSTADPNYNYVVKHFTEKLDGTFELKDTDNYDNKEYDSDVEYETNVYTGFTYDSSLDVNTDVKFVPANNELVLKLDKIIELGYDINDFDKILATVDLGIMVKNNSIYTNIEPDVLKWIYNNGFEDGLMQLASGYKSWLITFNPVEFMGKYMKLCKSYESKAALLGVRNRLMYDLLDGDTISINNGNKEYRMTIDTYKDTLLRYIRDKYETVNTMLESTLDDDLMTLEEIEQVSRFEKTRYDYNYDTKRKRNIQKKKSWK